MVYEKKGGYSSNSHFIQYFLMVSSQLNSRARGLLMQGWHYYFQTRPWQSWWPDSRPNPTAQQPVVEVVFISVKKTGEFISPHFPGFMLLVLAAGLQPGLLSVLDDYCKWVRSNVFWALGWTTLRKVTLQWRDGEHTLSSKLWTHHQYPKGATSELYIK